MSQAASTNRHPSGISHTTAMVRKATPADVSEIVAIHEKAFSNFFVTRLGPNFLREYYRLVLNYNAGIMLVSEGQDAGVSGFVCGFMDPVTFYRLMWHGKLGFALPVISALLRRPSLIHRVVSAIQRIQTPLEWPARTCELSSIAVEPEASHNGLGNALIRAFLACARSMNARCVYLTTDADGNEAVNEFYRGVGFQHTRRFLQREARWMNEYVINDLEADRFCGTKVCSGHAEGECGDSSTEFSTRHARRWVC
jgi:ribosomal protein S18 acetylase RimI-like enzyme